MPKKPLFGFITDPFEHFHPEMDNSLFYMKEVVRRGHPFVVCEYHDLFLRQNEPWATFKEVELTGRVPRFYKIRGVKKLPLKKLDCLFLRKDPPVDTGYLQHLYLLAKLEEEILMINSPSAILRWNEKLSALDFPFGPKTLISAKVDQIIEWSVLQKEGVVIKPLNDGSGRGVVKLTADSCQLSVKLIRKMTNKERLMVVVQEFLPQIKTGDQRIVLWNGKVLTHFIRVPAPGNFLANTAAGGKLVAYPLGAHEKKIAAMVGPWATKNKLYLVGLDVIRPYLTEINITSPAGVQQGNTVYGTHWERKIIGDVLRWI